MTVYPDLVFLIGCGISLAGYRLGMKLTDLHRPISWGIGAVIQGAFSALSVFPRVPVWLCVIGMLTCSCVVFRGKNLFGMLRNLGGYLFVQAIYAGLFLLLLSFCFSAKIFFTSEGGFFFASFADAVLAGGIAYLVGSLFLWLRKKRKRRSFYCDCEILISGERIPLRCYCDSGNLLTEPIGGLPVAVVEWSVLKKKFGRDFPRPMSYGFAERFSRKYRVVPFRTVSGEGQMLSGFIADEFSVCGKKQNAVIAVTEHTLEPCGRFYGIIGPDLWEDVI